MEKMISRRNKSDLESTTRSNLEYIKEQTKRSGLPVNQLTEHVSKKWKKFVLFFSGALFSAVRYGNHSRVVALVRSELRLTMTKISGWFSGYFSRLPDHKFASWAKISPQNYLLKVEIQQKIMNIWSREQGIDFYHANHFSNLFRIWWESFL